MKIIIRFFLILLVACAAIGFGTSCSDDNNCSLAGRAMMNCEFYHINPNGNKLEKDTLDSLTVTALGTDSILIGKTVINGMKRVHSISLPLRYSHDSTVLVFHYDFKRRPAYTDTLYVQQKNTPYFQSMECGYSMKQLIQKTSIRKGKIKGETRMDSIKITNANANINETQNLQIFFRYRDRIIN
ncbi:MAG: DUF6452 family protein [Bacteroides sp.]